MTEPNASATEYDYGPLRTYEIVWKSGHVETVQGHQVTFMGGDAGAMFSGLPGTPVRVRIHGMFPERDWRLVLSALEDDMVVIRDVTEPEQVRKDCGPEVAS